MKLPKSWIGDLWGRSNGQPKTKVEPVFQDDVSFNRTLIDARLVDTEERTVEVAFSSEQPVERAFGYEILDHTPGAMRTQRLEDGAALLVDHNFGDQIGVVESMRIDADGKARAKVRFGKSSRAEEIFQDVQDGIRKHISVGYRIHDMKETGKLDGIPMMRVTDWEPYEISIVSVPADPSVGVGRSEKPPEEKEDLVRDTEDHLMNRSEPAKEHLSMNTRILRNANGDLVKVKVDDQGAIIEEIEILESAATRQQQDQALLKKERERIDEVRGLAKRFDCEDLGERFLREIDNGTLDEFESWIKRHGQQPTDMRTMLNGRPTHSTSSPSELGLNQRDVNRFSFVRAINALANPSSRRAQEEAAFEIEVSEAYAKRTGKDSQGIFVPDEILQKRTQLAGTPETGGHTIATDHLASSYIDLLRNNAVMMRICKTMTGLRGDIEIPKQTGGASSYWVGEHEKVPETGVTFGQISMTPKSIGAYVDLSRKLMNQSSQDVENIVRSDLAKAQALGIDSAALYGTGTDKMPLGLFNQAGINAVAFKAENPSYEEVVQLETEINADNALAQRMRYILNTRMKGYFKTAQKFKGTNGSTVWEPGDTLNGYGTEVTNQLNLGDLLFGNFDDFLIALWGGLHMMVDPYSLSREAGLRVVTIQDVDFAIRRAESFCIGKKASTEG